LKRESSCRREADGDGIVDSAEATPSRSITQVLPVNETSVITIPLEIETIRVII
jgi:hypothetical protein